MKGISPLVSAVFLIAILLAALTIALRAGLPVIQKSQELAELEEAESTLLLIDSAINDISSEGEGSSRRLSLKSSGEYSIDPNADNVAYSMTSRYEIISWNSSFIRGPVTFDTTSPRSGSSITINMTLEYNNIDFVNSTRWKGPVSLFIKNAGKVNNTIQIESRVL